VLVLVAMGGAMYLGIVNGDGEECDVTVTQKHHMERSHQRNLLSICFCL
jgi:hypothetical protein